MIRRAAALILGLSVLIWFYALSQVLKAPIEQKRALDDWDNRPSAASPLVAAEAAAVKEPLSAMPAGADDSIPASSPQQKKSGDPLIGVLAFPDGKRVPLYQGVSAQQLQKGAGLDSNGAFPGEPGNSVISGHRDTVFRILSVRPAWALSIR
jgi:sortase A